MSGAKNWAAQGSGHYERRLQRIGRTAKDPVKLRRAVVVLMSAQGQSVPDIAHLLDCSPECVRGVIHAFSPADAPVGPIPR
jgi:Homeodomain-like domain